MLKVYNTLSRKKEAFAPRKGKQVNLFVCGPTVYDFSHIGHSRTYLVFDMVAKYLRQQGFKVFYLQNITDIDDKIIKRAKEEKISWKKLSQKFQREYLKDMKALKIDSVTKYAPATKYIKEIIGQVKRLLKKGFAYQTDDGVYYDIKKFKGYGKLSGRTATGAQDAVSRIDESKDKRNKGDFCLWKISKPEEPAWPSPWGKGRPGWHIEDTAITEKFFGPQYDIHGGARDLIFPHHEAEISQMEAISGKTPLVKYWLHTGFLTVKGEKMAKSLGNFITIKDFLEKYSGRLLRLFVLKTHYRSPINYDEKEISEVKKQLEKIDNFIDKLKSKKAKKKVKIESKNLLTDMVAKFQKDFDEAVADDFNTPKAAAALFKLINEGNTLLSQNKISAAAAGHILEFLKRTDEFFGFIFWTKTKEKISTNVLNLVKEREKQRLAKNWQRADELRDKIENLGYLIEDTIEGPKIIKKS